MGRGQFTKDKDEFKYTPRASSKTETTKKNKTSVNYAQPEPTGGVPSVFPGINTIDYQNTPLSYENKTVNGQGLLPKPSIIAPTNTKPTDTNTNLVLGDYDYNNIYDAIYSSSASGSGATKVDVSALLDAYRQQAEASNAVAKQAYSSRRDQLLNEIKRAYAANDLAMRRQNQDFINKQADLEASGTANARNMRLEAGARGLSGSGLQQLAQLKNLLGQASAVSEVSVKNEAALEKLRASLANMEDKTMGNLEDALNNYTKNALSANDRMAINSADKVMEAETAYANALKNSYSSSSGSTYGMASNMVYNTLIGTSDLLKNTLDRLSKMSIKELKTYAKDNGINIKGVKSSNLKGYLSNQAATDAQQSIYDLNDTYPINPATYNLAYQNIANLLKYYS